MPFFAKNMVNMSLCGPRRVTSNSPGWCGRFPLQQKSAPEPQLAFPPGWAFCCFSSDRGTRAAKDREGSSWGVRAVSASRLTSSTSQTALKAGTQRRAEPAQLAGPGPRFHSAGLQQAGTLGARQPGLCHSCRHQARNTKLRASESAPRHGAEALLASRATQVPPCLGSQGRGRRGHRTGKWGSKGPTEPRGFVGRRLPSRMPVGFWSPAPHKHPLLTRGPSREETTSGSVARVPVGACAQPRAGPRRSPTGLRRSGLRAL